MVVQNSSTNDTSNSLSSPSTNPMHLWKKFKNEKPEESQNYEKVEKEEPRRKLTRAGKWETHSHSSSNSSHERKMQISNKTVVAEKIFCRQLENHRQRHSRDSSSSTNSSFDSVERKREYIKSNSNKENTESRNMTGALHFTKPVAGNTIDVEKYYENKGRMDHQPIDWNNGSTMSISQEKEPERMRNPELPKETIKTTAVSKPQVSDEFSNFVKNSVLRNVAYVTQGNIQRNANTSECFLYKTQQLTNKAPLETIRIPADVRKSILKPKPGFHLFNRIDNFKVSNPEENANGKLAEVARHVRSQINKHIDTPNANSHSDQYSKMPNKRERLINADPKQERESFNNVLKPRCTDNNHSQNTYQPKQTDGVSNHVKNRIQSRNFYGTPARGNTQSSECATIQPLVDKKLEYVNIESTDTCNMVQIQSGIKKEEGTKNDLSTHDCDDYDMVSYVNSLSHEENIAKKESRKQGLKIEDDLFDFVQNQSEKSSKILDLPTPPTRRFSSYNFPFDKYKKMCLKEAKVNKTIDSDDTFNVSSDIENLSVSIVSTHDRLRAFQKKRMLEGTCAYKKTQNSPVLPDENDDSKVLENKNQLLNRCLRASHDYQEVHANNVVEITNVKVGPKPEPLLKPISTRYFEKPSKSVGIPSNKNSDETEKTEHSMPPVNERLTTRVLNSTPIKDIKEEREKNSNFDICIKSNASVENISSISTFSADGADSKTDFKNNKIPLKVNRNDREIDSDLCNKSVENSEVRNNVSETKFNSEIKNDKICDVSSHEEPINISENIESVIESKNNNSTKLELEKKYEMAKDEYEFEELSSDSENDLMDCKDYIDFDAFEVENIDMFFPDLNQKVENLKKALSSGMDNNGLLCLTDSPNNNEIQSLDSDGESSNNNNSSLNTSASSNFNAENSCSPFNFNSVFDKVDIKLSELQTSGLIYDDIQKKKTELSTQKVLNKEISLDAATNHRSNSVSLKKITKQKNTGKENIEENLNKNEVSARQHPEAPKHNNDTTTITPTTVSKKMQKYRSTLKNYKNKLKTDADQKEDDKNIQQADDASQHPISNIQEPSIRRPIATAIRERLSQLF